MDRDRGIARAGSCTAELTTMRRRRIVLLRGLSLSVIMAVAPVACSKGAKEAGDSAAAHPTVGAKTILIVPQSFTETLGE